MGFRTLLTRAPHSSGMVTEPATTDSLAREATATGFGFFSAP
jgi:hypothetical protein